MSEVDDAIILAGGMGTRMLPASLYMPKETLPLVDTPLLNHLIWEASMAGVSRIHLVLSERKMVLLEEFFGDGSVFSDDIRMDLPREALSMGTKGVEIIPYIQKHAGGVADAISVAIGSIEGPFIVILGDMVILEEHLAPDILGPERASSASMELVDEHKRSGLPCVGVREVEPELVSNYGVVEIRDGRILSIVEKPEISEAPSNVILCGRYILPKNTAKILDEYPASKFGEMQSIHLLNHLIDTDGLMSVDLSRMQMYDSGDPLSWLKSQIDHAVRRNDIGPELIHWIENRIK